MRRVALSLAMLALGAGVIGHAAAQRAAGKGIREGGTFRIALPGVDFVDPALSYQPWGWALLDTTCARLMTYPDKPLPKGLRLVPEVAVGYPRVSHDRKTWTFTLRRGFRFSDGTPVRASAFARAIYRTLAPGMNSPGAQYTQAIVGAEDVLAGRRQTVTGVVARGNTLVVRFTRPVPDFAAQTTMPFFCAVPPALPADPEGVPAPFPGAGPYYVAEYRPEQKVVILRNRFYRGTRPHHVDRFVVDQTAPTANDVLDRIERGGADWGRVLPSAYFNPARRLAAKYGVNRSQFFVKPSLVSHAFAFNVSRPLFRNNARLRRAVNFAVDRRALRRAFGPSLSSTLTDQYLPRALPAFHDAQIYPLDGSGLQRARSLARGNTRAGKAVLYTFHFPVALAVAQVLKQNLARIGLDVEVKGLPPDGYFERLASPNEPWDIAFSPWGADYVDPYSFLNFQFDGRFIGANNLSRFDSPRYNRLLRQAARLQGRARDRAYGRLDVQLARDAAPMIAFQNPNEPTLVSRRVDPRCIVVRPALDLTAVCLK